ncbi:hypothetical protein PVAP13_1NG365119 [Panicum virgatum]|uniref:Uncharacterized protein n=1 Tax=Panicum virgatum TaxID=38727 RepID=A0A8T0XA23_PANVG|nr:hypothetical protein PVAP13_1NG365119 [Panicum virgatum]
MRARRARWPLLRTAIVRARRRSLLLTALDRCSAVAPDPRRARSPRTLAPAPDGHRPHAPTFTATEGTRPLLRRSPCPTAIPRAAAPMATALDGPRSRRPQLRRPSIPTDAAPDGHQSRRPLFGRLAILLNFVFTFLLQVQITV